MKWLSILVVSLLLFTSCIKKADRLSKNTKPQDDEAFMQNIYLQAQGAAKEKNHLRSIYLHEKNCALGYAPSCNRLAYRYYKGDIIKTNHTKAQILYHRACSQLGDHLACFNEANMLRSNHKDYHSARISYDAMCNAGHHNSCYNLAVMYYKGQGVKKRNKKKAAKIIKQACHNGYNRACKIVGKMKKGKITYLPNAQ